MNENGFWPCLLSMTQGKVNTERFLPCFYSCLFFQLSDHVYVIRPKSKLLRQRLDFLPRILQSYFSGLSTNSRIEGTCKESFSAKVSKSNFLVQSYCVDCWHTSKVIAASSFSICRDKSADCWASSMCIFLKLWRNTISRSFKKPWLNGQVPGHLTQWFLTPKQYHRLCKRNRPCGWSFSFNSIIAKIGAVNNQSNWFLWFRWY